ncbi:hypothetical protein [Streptomyces sp. NPDC048644]
MVLTIWSLGGFRRLRIRWEIRGDIHDAFLKLACWSSPTDTSKYVR